MLVTLLALVVVLGVLVFVHEFGHFLAAKWAGIWVHRFSLGIGTPIPRPHVQTRRNGIFAVVAPPRRLREDGEPGGGCVERRPGGRHSRGAGAARRMFEAKPVWKRMIVILAGVTMNALFAWLIFTGLALKNGKAVNPVTVIGFVDSAGMPAGAEAFRTLRLGTGSRR